MTFNLWLISFVTCSFCSFITSTLTHWRVSWRIDVDFFLALSTSILNFCFLILNLVLFFRNYICFCRLYCLLWDKYCSISKELFIGLLSDGWLIDKRTMTSLRLVFSLITSRNCAKNKLKQFFCVRSWNNISIHCLLQ